MTYSSLLYVADVQPLDGEVSPLLVEQNLSAEGSFWAVCFPADLSSCLLVCQAYRTICLSACCDCVQIFFLLKLQLFVLVLVGIFIQLFGHVFLAQHSSRERYMHFFIKICASIRANKQTLGASTVASALLYACAHSRLQVYTCARALTCSSSHPRL